MTVAPVEAADDQTDGAETASDEPAAASTSSAELAFESCSDLPSSAQPTRVRISASVSATARIETPAIGSVDNPATLTRRFPNMTDKVSGNPHSGQRSVLRAFRFSATFPCMIRRLHTVSGAHVGRAAHTGAKNARYVLLSLGLVNACNTGERSFNPSSPLSTHPQEAGAPSVEAAGSSVEAGAPSPEAGISTPVGHSAPQLPDSGAASNVLTSSVTDGGTSSPAHDAQVSPFDASATRSQTTDAPYDSAEMAPDAGECGANSFSESGRAPCTAWTTCNPGQYISTIGTPTTDRSCSDCTTSQYSNAENSSACTPCRACWWLGEQSSCTNRHDTVCRVEDVSQQFGSPADDVAMTSSVDLDGNVWVAGYTEGGLQGSNAGGRDAFVKRLPAGANSPFIQQFGSAQDEEVRALVLDSHGNVWVGGLTTGKLGSQHYGSEDAFVRVYPANGADLATDQFGTASADRVNGMTVDRAGNVWVVGATAGTLDEYHHGDRDAFLRKYPAVGGAPLTRQFGTSSADEAIAIAVDHAGNAWVAGNTYGKLSGANVGDQDCFVQRYDADGVLKNTYQFGTASKDTVTAAAVDGAGSLWVTGVTEGALVTPSLGAQDGFLRQYPADGSKPVTHQFGAQDNDTATALAIDGANSVWVTGVSTMYGGAQVATLRGYAAGSSTPRQREFALTTGDLVLGIAAHPAGDIWVTGATTGALDGTNQGGLDAFVRQVAFPSE